MRAEILLGFLFFFSTALLEVESCQSDKILKCQELLTSVTLNTFFYTQEQTQHFCKVIDDFLVCMNGTGCLAIPEVAKMADLLRNSMNYLCKDHFNEYLKHVRCLNSENDVKWQEFCEEESKKLSKPECENKNLLHNCFVGSVNGCCGDDAANFVDGLLKVLHNQMTPTGECPLEPDFAVPYSQFCNTAATSSSNIIFLALAFILSISFKIILGSN